MKPHLVCRNGRWYCALRTDPQFWFCDVSPDEALRLWLLFCGDESTNPRSGGTAAQP